MLIVLEGIDKCGKGAQAKLLLHTLPGAKEIHDHLRPLLIKFPRYDTPIGKMIRSHLKGYWGARIDEIGVQNADEIAGAYNEVEELNTDAMAFQALMLADKCLAAPDIQDRQEAKLTTVCDRYWQSALAYGVADGLDEESLLVMHRVLPQANLNILIDVPVDVAMSRGRDERPDEPDRYERDREKLERVRKNYLDLWAEQRIKGWGWAVIDGALPLMEVHARILAEVQS